MRLSSIWLLYATLGGALAYQTTFNIANNHNYLNDFASPGSETVGTSTNDPFNITTLHLSQIKSSEAFTTLGHPKFPHHQVRVKKTEFCDPTVNVFTGYLDVDQGAKHLFFYFFESRHDPDKDDVMMWINGGPGCSSSIGLLMELGPCSIDMSNSSANGTVRNPYGWNSEANIFFLDQPVGVGYSYADFGETIFTTEDAAKNVHAFITIFFETFSQFKGRPLHLAGESYGGRYLPVFASEIYDQNTIAEAEGRPTLNLKSVLIGNGITDISTVYSGRFAVECGPASFDKPFQPISTCVQMKRILPRCQKLLQRNCIDELDQINCEGSGLFCETALSTAYVDTGRNVYDMSKPCIGSDLCYEEIGVIQSFLNNATIRKTLGVETDKPFTSCDDEVGMGFNSRGDYFSAPTQFYVAGLLERGVRVLIYAGTYDWVCNWVSNLLWVEKLEWSGKWVYNTQKWKVWGVGEIDESAHALINQDGILNEAGRVMSKGAGITKRAGPLTYVSIWGAGHMHAPHDKPVESLAMVYKWLKGEL